MALIQKHSNCPIINNAVRRLLKNDWQRLKGKGHPRIKSPDGKITLTVPKSPSCSRTAQNWLSQIRNLGVVLD